MKKQPKSTMDKDKYDLLRDKTQRIVVEGERLLKRKKSPSHFCHKDCASCLAAEARRNIDIKDFGHDLALKAMFDSTEDICMLNARDILAKKYNLKIM